MQFAKIKKTKPSCGALHLAHTRVTVIFRAALVQGIVAHALYCKPRKEEPAVDNFDSQLAIAGQVTH